MNKDMLEEMAEEAQLIYQGIVRINEETNDPVVKTESYEIRASSKWLMDKLEQLISERKLQPRRTTGVEL